MSTFQALMAISASQTKESQSAVQAALAQRQRNEELRRKQQAEQEQKEQELARKIRLKHFEDERREREKQQRLEEDRLAKQAALQKREEEARDALRYGPKRAKALSSTPEGSSPKWPSSSSQTRVRTEVRKRRLPDDKGDDDDGTPEFLTREEKREKRQVQEMKKLFHASKRSSGLSGHSSRPRKRLPGGAVDVTLSAQIVDGAASANKSVKERITAMPNTLTKLNTVKRDTRTIDEILQDRAKAREVKVLDGDEARVFDDWFGSSKKKEKGKEAPKKSPPQPGASVATSGANTPASQSSNQGGASPLPSNLAKKVPVPLKSSQANLAPTKGTVLGPAYSTSKSATLSRPSSSDRYLSMAGTKIPKVSVAPPAKKRLRSPSLSDSPPPKRQAQGGSDYRDEIWKLFRKDRSAYVSKNVFSDDEDMEADTTALEREEKQSALMAKREDIIALEEERRHEEEKRRRKKEAMREQRS